jgi:hypothetical protein
MPKILNILILLCFPFFAEANAETAPVQLPAETAMVSHLEGNADLLRPGIKEKTPLSEGDKLEENDRVQTRPLSRIELALADGSFVRFNENTTFELTSLRFNEQKSSRLVKIKMFLGKTWAKVADLLGDNKDFEFQTKTATAGIRGTTFQINTKTNGETLIRVYWGEILVQAKEKGETEQEKSVLLKRPFPVMGPTKVNGPREVSPDKWQIILKSMQQVTVRPDGTATKAFPFLETKDDNEWMQWNRERDRNLEE